MSSKKRIGPCQLEFPSNDEKDFLFDATEHSTFLWSFVDSICYITNHSELDRIQCIGAFRNPRDEIKCQLS